MTAFVKTHDSANMTVGFLDFHPFGGMVAPLGGALPTLFARYEGAALPAGESLQPGVAEASTARAVLGLSMTQWGVLQMKLEGQRYLSAGAAIREASGYSRTRWYLQLVLVL